MGECFLDFLFYIDAGRTLIYVFVEFFAGKSKEEQRERQRNEEEEGDEDEEERGQVPDSFLPKG